MDHYTCILKIIDFFGKKILKKSTEGCNKRTKFKERKDKCKAELSRGINEKQAIQSGKLRVFITSMP